MISQNKGEGKFWQIVKLYYDVNEKDLQVELHGYKSVADLNAAQTGVKTAVHKLKFTLSGAEFPDVNKANLMTSVENAIKDKLKDRVI